jgi:hypothetical protein
MQPLALRTPSGGAVIHRVHKHRIPLQRIHHTSQSRLHEVILRQPQHATHTINQLETRALPPNPTHRTRQERRINAQLASKPPQADTTLLQKQRHLVAKRALSTPTHQQTSRSNTTRACWSY